MLNSLKYVCLVSLKIFISSCNKSKIVRLQNYQTKRCILLADISDENSIYKDNCDQDESNIKAIISNKALLVRKTSAKEYLKIGRNDSAYLSTKYQTTFKIQEVEVGVYKAIVKKWEGKGKCLATDRLNDVFVKKCKKSKRQQWRILEPF
ncbi:MAG: hypothetical protein AAGF07_04935 [Patescibacteria group bacterium]